MNARLVPVHFDKTPSDAFSFSYLTDRFHLNRADSHGFEALAQPYFRTV